MSEQSGPTPEPYVCAEGHVYTEPAEGGGCPLCNAEYQQGIADAREYQGNRDTFGQEYADSVEFLRDFNEG